MQEIDKLYRNKFNFKSQQKNIIIFTKFHDKIKFK